MEKRLKTFLHSNSICYMCSTPNFTRRGDRGARFTSFCKAALLRCGGLQEKRKKNREKERKKERKRIKQRNHNYIIKEHNISYLDTKNEISLKMFIIFISFRRQFDAPEVFFP